MNSDRISSENAATSSQKLKLFMRGSAMSGAPICSGIIQLARPTVAGMTAPNTMISACTVVIVLKKPGSTSCMPGMNSSARITSAIAPPMKNMTQAEHQVHRADVLVIRRRQPAHDALRRAMVVVVVVRVRRGRESGKRSLIDYSAFATSTVVVSLAFVVVRLRSVPRALQRPGAQPSALASQAVVLGLARRRGPRSA